MGILTSLFCSVLVLADRLGQLMLFNFNPTKRYTDNQCPVHFCSVQSNPVQSYSIQFHCQTYPQASVKITWHKAIQQAKYLCPRKQSITQIIHYSLVRLIVHTAFSTSCFHNNFAYYLFSFIKIFSKNFRAANLRSKHTEMCLIHSSCALIPTCNVPKISINLNFLNLNNKYI